MRARGGGGAHLLGFGNPKLQQPAHWGIYTPRVHQLPVPVVMHLVRELRKIPHLQSGCQVARQVGFMAQFSPNAHPIPTPDCTQRALGSYD